MQERVLSVPGIAATEALRVILTHEKVEFKQAVGPYGPVLVIAQNDYMRVKDIVQQWAHATQWIYNAV